MLFVTTATGGRIKYINPMNGHGPFRFKPEHSGDNIIVITMDMVPPEFYLDIHGKIKPDTPNIDQLKNQGIFFSNAYSTSPLCSPSRASYLTGRYSYITTNSERAHDGHEIHLRDSDIIYPEYLKASGYHTRHIGKSHTGTHKFMDAFGENDSPWNRWSPPWYDEDRYISFLNQKGFSRFSFKKEIFGKDLTGTGRGNSYGGWIGDQNGRPFPPDATYPAFLVQQAAECVAARKGKNKPLYLQLDFFGPHQPFAIPAGMDKREREIRNRLKLPESYLKLSDKKFNAPWPEPRVYRMYRKNWGLYDKNALEDYTTAQILQFEILDTMLGKFFTTLKEEDLFDDSWIFLFADHGEMNGELALVDKGAFLNPRVIQTPLIVKPPSGSHTNTGIGLPETPSVIRTPVSLLDIAPAILEIAGISHDERTDGVSLFNTINGKKRPENKPVLCEIWSHVIPNPAAALIFEHGEGNRKRKYMFTFNATDDIDELYVLDWEVPFINLFADKACRNIVEYAVSKMGEIFKHDERWKGYFSFIALQYPEIIKGGKTDRQKFL